MAAECGAACEGGVRVRMRVGWGLPQSPHVIHAWRKKKRKKKRRKSHTGPLSHFYGNLKAIIVPCHSLWKGFSWRGAGRGGERGGQRAAFSLLTAGKQREEEWMSKRKTPPCGVIQQKSAATHRITLLTWGIFCFDTRLAARWTYSGAFSDRSIFWTTAEDQSCRTREKVDLDSKLVCQMASVGLQLQIYSTT